MEPRVAAPQDADYASLPAVERELRRVFDICHGCRRCFNLCPSFDTMFKRIDEKEGKAPPTKEPVADEVAALSVPELDRVVDECYQCKLCYNHCPYTPPHRFAIDFPRLMLRAKVANVRARGGNWTDKLLARVDQLGRINVRFSRLVNFANANRLFRLLLEKIAGIDRRRNLPEVAAQTFSAWFKKNHFSWRPTPKPAYKGKVVLFHTCFVEFNDPEVGRAAVQVLEANECEILNPPQNCCGMPFLDAGDADGAVRLAKKNVDFLLPHARAGVPILALGPTCSYMLKHEYPYLLNTPEAREVAAASKDIGEYLMERHKAGILKIDFPGWDAGQSISYHLPCHLKAQNIGFKSRDLLSLLPESRVRMVDRCSAHDGTWSMKKEWFELSMKTGKKFFDEMAEGKPDWVVSDCPLAALQLEKGIGRRALHPVQILARAYGRQEAGLPRTEKGGKR